MTKLSSRVGEREPMLRRVGKAIREMLNTAEDVRALAAREQQLHTTDFACISYLYNEEGPVSPKQIIARLGLTSGSGTALIDRLEQAGYIRRLPNPDDRRSVLIELNRAAAAEPIGQYVRMQELFLGVTDQFSDDELVVITRFLEQLGELPIGEALKAAPAA